MKTKTLIILALLSLNITLVSAGKFPYKGTDGPSKSEYMIPLNLVAPVTPIEATFEDSDDPTGAMNSISSLAPVTAKEATFEDLSPMAQNQRVVNTQIKNVKQTEKAKMPHPYFPPPCNDKYGCSL